MVNKPDLDDELDSFDEIKELQAIEDELNDALYKVGYDTGFFEGVKTGQETLADSDDVAYEAALCDIIDFIQSIEFTDKQTLLDSLQQLRRVAAEK